MLLRRSLIRKHQRFDPPHPCPTGHAGRRFVRHRLRQQSVQRAPGHRIHTQGRHSPSAPAAAQQFGNQASAAHCQAQQAPSTSAARTPAACNAGAESAEVRKPSIHAGLRPVGSAGSSAGSAESLAPHSPPSAANGRRSGPHHTTPPMRSHATACRRGPNHPCPPAPRKDPLRWGSASRPAAAIGAPYRLAQSSLGFTMPGSVLTTGGTGSESPPSAEVRKDP